MKQEVVFVSEGDNMKTISKLFAILSLSAIRGLRREVEREFPVIARLTAASLGPFLLWSTRREEKRLAAGQTYEPPTFVERRNWVAVS